MSGLWFDCACCVQSSSLHCWHVLHALRLHCWLHGNTEPQCCGHATSTLKCNPSSTTAKDLAPWLRSILCGTQHTAGSSTLGCDRRQVIIRYPSPWF